MCTMKFAAIKVQSVADAVQDQLKAMIVEGTLKPHERLPNEIDLARQLGVGRSAVREALRSLQTHGLVERTREGTFVRDADWDILNEPIEYLLAVKPCKCDELLECRQILEEASVARAAERATPADLERLSFHMSAMSAAAESADAQGFVDANFAFHRRIVRASHNSILLTLYDNLTRPIKETLATASRNPGAVERSLIQHGKILDAIAGRDPEEARLVMVKHLAHTGLMLDN